MPKQYNLGDMKRDFFLFGHYDYAEAANALATVSEFDTVRVMRALFDMVTEDCDPDDHFCKWLAVMKFYASIMRHPQQSEPMLAPDRELMHPLALLWLGEARGGKTARLMCELAMINGYKDRVICVAVHMCAEVFWDGKWHFIDPNANYPISTMREWGDLPSIEELSLKPDILDTIPFRKHVMGPVFNRTLDGKIVSEYASFLHKNSAKYFGREYFLNRFGGDRSRPRKGITVCCKNNDFAGWEKSQSYGWEKASYTEIPTPMIPVETIPFAPQLCLPNVFYGAQTEGASLPMSFYPVEYPAYDFDADKFYIKEAASYEVRVSSSTRGWDYDYPLHERLGEAGIGDILVTRDLKKENGMMCLDIPKEKIINFDQIYIEARSFSESQTYGNEFIWPSREHVVRIAL